MFAEEYLNEVAKRTGFCLRRRKITPGKFLRSLLFKGFDGALSSLNDQVADLSINENTTICKQSLDERYNSSAVAFVKEILTDQIQNQFGVSSPDELKNFSSVFIQDATRIKLPLFLKAQYPGFSNNIGPSAGMSVQFVYDLTRKTIHTLSIESALTNDSTYACKLDWLKEKSLLIRDLGYYTNQALKTIIERKAYFLSRLKPKTVLFEKVGNEYRRIDIKGLLNYMQKNNISYLDKKYFVSTADKIPSRVCIFLVPEEVRERRIRKNKTYNSGKGYQCTEEFSIWSGLNIFITNIEQEILDIKAVANLYGLRWQIELLFKTWKSYYKIEKLKVMKQARIECMIYASLLYIIIHWKILSAIQFIHADLAISTMKFCKFMIICKEKLRNALFNKISSNLKFSIVELIEKIDLRQIKVEKRKRQKY